MSTPTPPPSTPTANSLTTSTAPAAWPRSGWDDDCQQRLIPTPLGELHVRVGGRPDGDPMVFWPSLMMTGAMFHAQHRHYAPTHRTVLIDPPGIGGSAPLRSTITLEQCAQALLAVLDALNIDRCLYVGCSWGALLGSTFAAWHPERLTGAVLTNGTATPPARPERLQMTPLITLIGRYRSTPRWLVPVARSAFTGPTARKHKPDVLRFLEQIHTEDPRSISTAMRSVLLGRTDRHALLRTITDVPVLVIAGEEDAQFAVPEVRRMAQAIPDSRFVVLPQTAHLAPLESPDLVNDAIDEFLASTTT